MFKGIISIVAFGVALAIFFMYTQPTYDSIKGVKAEIQKYDEALDKANELQQLKQSLLARYNAFDPNNVSRLQKLLPDHVDNVRLVLDLDNMAGKHGMALQNVVISNPASETGDTSVVGTIGTARQKYDSLTLRFSTRATYSTFVQFLEDLEANLRITDVISMMLTPETDSSNGAAGGEPNYRFDITIRTYWLK